MGGWMEGQPERREQGFHTGMIRHRRARTSRAKPKARGSTTNEYSLSSFYTALVNMGMGHLLSHMRNQTVCLRTSGVCHRRFLADATQIGHEGSGDLLRLVF